MAMSMPQPVAELLRRCIRAALATPLPGLLALLLILASPLLLPAGLLPTFSVAAAAGIEPPASPPAPASQAGPPALAYRCAGLPLTATLHGGAVDDPSIPNRSGGTLPGAFVQLQWQQAGEPIALQLPRTNNAGPPSFTDGKWWWSIEDPDHPRFRLRRGGGDIEDFVCERA